MTEILRLEGKKDQTRLSFKYKDTDKIKELKRHHMQEMSIRNLG
jgi:hypothetical protein